MLEQKFALGLFESPFVDEDAADEIVGNPAFMEEGRRAQRRSIVFIERSADLVLKPESRIYLSRISPDAFTAAGLDEGDGRLYCSKQ